MISQQQRSDNKQFLDLLQRPLLSNFPTGPDIWSDDDALEQALQQAAQSCSHGTATAQQLQPEDLAGDTPLR
jgi:hypothetical protein